MAGQEQQPLLASPVNSSSWPSQPSAWTPASPYSIPCASGASSSSAHTVPHLHHNGYGALLSQTQPQQCSTQAYAGHAASGPHSAPTQLPQHNWQQQQQPQQLQVAAGAAFGSSMQGMMQTWPQGSMVLGPQDPNAAASFMGAALPPTTQAAGYTGGQAYGPQGGW